MDAVAGTRRLLMHFQETRAAIPSEVLQRPDVREAIERHDFGQVFTLARKWAGISYSRIAEACGIKPDRVGALARGQGNITSYEKIAVIADGLRIPGRMLGLAERPWETVAIKVVVASHNADGGEAVRRRDLLRVSLVGATAALGLGDTLGKVAQGRVGASLPVILRSRTARLRKLDDVLGGGDTFQLYLAEYESTKSFIRGAHQTAAVKKELLTVLAEQAQQAGWAAFDMGDHVSARRLYEESRSIAIEADSDALTGNALAFLAYQEISKHPTVAVNTAEQSCAIVSEYAPSSVRALLHERRAWAHAVAGNASAADAALTAAQVALSEVNGEPQPDWSSWVDQQELRIMSGRCWTELHRPLRAVPVLEDVLRSFDDTHARDKALYSCWLADSYLMAGEIEAAADVASRVLTLSTGVASVRPRERLQPLLAQLEPHRGLADIAQVLDQARIS
jgi:transcriptional regulator with XRE-family HTH domain